MSEARTVPPATESHPCSVALAAGVEATAEAPAAFSYARPSVGDRERRSSALPLVQVWGRALDG